MAVEQPSQDQDLNERRERLRKAGCWCDKHNCERDVETDCHRCHGDGMIEDQDDVIGGSMERCYACNGSGVGWPDCEWCLDEDDL